MVIFDDLHKLLIYQRLNLGFECQVCKKKFLNKLDHLQHTSSCKEQIKCPKCGKKFGHHQIFHLHMKFHNLSRLEDCQSKTDSDKLINSNEESKSTHGIIIGEETRTTSDRGADLGNQTDVDTPKDGKGENVNQEKNEPLPTTIDITTTNSPKKQSSHKNRSRSKAVKKKIGLTKIKMEDCLRCDDCSCIYIDEKDYYKHMRNFHQLDVNNMPIARQKTKRKCRSCCQQCRGINCSPVKRPRITHSASNLIFKINMRDNIKDRWMKMVSPQISEFVMPHPGVEEVQIKPDPDSATVKSEPPDTLDLSHLLSQVEVKIKTEPSDDYNF